MKSMRDRYVELWKINKNLTDEIYEINQKEHELYVKNLTKRINNLKDSLVLYKKKIKESPNSLFYKGSIKNCKELISELEITLKKQNTKI